MRIYFLAVSLLVSCVFQNDLFAQNYLFKAYNSSNGLLSDYTFGIFQDSKGNMWFGGDRGVSMYNGRDWRYFTTDNGLSSNFTYSFAETLDGDILIGGLGANLSIYKNGVLRPVPIPSEAQLGGFTSMITLPSGIILAQGGHGLLLYHNGNIKVMSYDKGVTIMKESHLRIVNEHSVLLSCYLINVPTFEEASLQKLTFIKDDGSLFTAHPNYSNWSILPDGQFVVTFGHLLFPAELHGTQVKLGSRLDLKDVTTSSFCLDDGTVLYGGRSLGLLAVKQGNVSTIRFNDTEDNPITYVMSLFRDYEGNLWASVFGSGIYKMTSWDIEFLVKPSELSATDYRQLAHHNGITYIVNADQISSISDNGKLVHLFDMSDIPKFSLQQFHRIYFHNDQIHISTLGGLFLPIPVSKLSDINKPKLRFLETGATIMAMNHDVHGNMWYNRYGHETLIKAPDGSVSQYKGAHQQDLHLTEKMVRFGDDLWFFTDGFGAIQLTKDSLTVYNRSHGYPTNTLFTLFERENTYYFGSDRGIMMVDKHTQHASLITEGFRGLKVIGIFPLPDSDELLVVSNRFFHRFNGIEFKVIGSINILNQENVAIQDIIEVDGNYLAATNIGLLRISQQALSRKQVAPKIAIERIHIKDELFQPFQEYALSHNASLRFSLATMSYINESENQITYKLDGLDKEWSEPIKTSTVQYGYLPPGEYRFRAKGINADGISSTQEAVFYFAILPPFWQTWPFLFPVIFCAIALISIAVHYRIKTVQQSMIKRNELKQFEAIQRIGAALSHDIKNTVFSLRLLSNNLEKRFDNAVFRKDAIETIDASLQHLEQLVKHLQERPDTWKIEKRHQSLTECIQHCGVRCAQVVAAQAELQIITPQQIMAFFDAQVLERVLENVIKNAAEAIEHANIEKGVIKLIVVQDKDQLFIKIEDNGPGMTEEFIQKQLFKPFKSTKSKGFGLGLYTCKELLTAHNSDISVKSTPGMGTQFIIRL